MPVESVALSCDLVTPLTNGRTTDHGMNAGEKHSSTSQKQHPHLHEQRTFNLRLLKFLDVSGNDLPTAVEKVIAELKNRNSYLVQAYLNCATEGNDSNLQCSSTENTSETLWSEDVLTVDETDSGATSPLSDDSSAFSLCGSQTTSMSSTNSLGALDEATDKNEYGMTSSQFRHHGKQTIEYMANYMETVHERRVVPTIEPGYLKEHLPTDAPSKPESFERIMEDFEKLIMPGVTHWQHPRFHAYFPAGNSWPSILADMLSDVLGCVGFSWASCPSMTELETIVMEWLGKMMGLPPAFLPFTENGKGGGVIQSSASDCNLVALLAARHEALKQLRQRFPEVEEGVLLSKLVAYTSKEAHSSLEKACMIGMVKLRLLRTDLQFRLRGDELRNAIEEDIKQGLFPFFVAATLGTTSCCSFDVLQEIGPICQEHDLWLHVDAAYAGCAMICPEFRPLMDGVEYAMSIHTNPNKWLLVNFDCSTMWVRDQVKLTQALVVDPLYLQHNWTGRTIDYRHWSIPLSRRFRSLKLWFVIRSYGVEGLQVYIREHVRLAKQFESLLSSDSLFEILGDVIMGLVSFRIKATDAVNRQLLSNLNASGRIHMVPASLNDRFVIRFCVCAENATEEDIQMAYEIISEEARRIVDVL